MVNLSILTYNRLDVTKKCLQSILDNTDLNKVRVIVSDNGSTDGTREYLKSLDYIWYVENEKNLGFAAAHNQIMRVFPFEDIVLINNDIEVDKFWFEYLQEKIDEGFGAVSPAIITQTGYDIGAILDSNAKGKSIVIKDMNENTPEPHWISGSCIYISRDTINKIGKLPEEYGFYYEDVDYCVNMKNNNIKFICDRRVIIKHYNSASSNPEQKKRMIEESRQKFIKKWNWK